MQFVRYDVNQVRAESAVFSQSGEEDLVVDCDWEGGPEEGPGRTTWGRQVQFLLLDLFVLGSVRMSIQMRGQLEWRCFLG